MERMNIMDEISVIYVAIISYPHQESTEFPDFGTIFLASCPSPKDLS